MTTFMNNPVSSNSSADSPASPPVLGIIAGSRSLPLLLARQARRAGVARALMQAQLQRVASHPGLSRNTLEIVTKALSL